MLSWGTANLADPAFYYYLNFENSLTQRFGTKTSYFWKTYIDLNFQINKFCTILLNNRPKAS